MFRKQTALCSLHFYVINLMILETGKRPPLLIRDQEEGEERKSLNVMQQKKCKKEIEQL